MTTKNASTKSVAKTAIACMLASALAAGAVAVPALASSLAAPVADGTPVVVQEGWGGIARPHEYGMSQGEAVWIARTYLAIEPEEVRDLDVDRVMFDGTPCYEVEIETFACATEFHVLVEAQEGTVLATWSE